MTTTADLRKEQRAILAAIGHHFLDTFDRYALANDHILLKLIEDLERVEKQIKVSEMPL